MTSRPRPLTALAVGILLFAPSVGFIAAVQVIATAKAGPASTAGALALIVIIDLAFAWVPVAVYLVAPDRTTQALKAMNAWLALRGRAVLTASLGAIGVFLLIDGAIGLA